MSFLLFSGGIICVPHPGSFAVQFGDHFRSGDHVRRYRNNRLTVRLAGQYFCSIISKQTRWPRKDFNGGVRLTQPNVSTEEMPVTTKLPCYPVHEGIIEDRPLEKKKHHNTCNRCLCQGFQRKSCVSYCRSRTMQR